MNKETEMVFAITDKKTGKIINPNKFERAAFASLAAKTGSTMSTFPVYLGPGKRADAFAITTPDSYKFLKTWEVIKEVLLDTDKRVALEYFPFSEDKFVDALKKFYGKTKLGFYDWCNMDCYNQYATTGVGVVYKKDGLTVDDYEGLAFDDSLNVNVLAEKVLHKHAIFTPETITESIWIR